MNNLSVLSTSAVRIIDSREVAEMVGKEHFHLVRDIKGYIKILENSSIGSQSKIGFSEFFIESNYKDSTGRTLNWLWKKQATHLLDTKRKNIPL